MRRWIKQLKQDENGQVIVFFALIFPVLCIMVAFAVDIGWIFHKQSKIQYAADLSALSGAQHLPEDTTAASNTAKTIFEENFGAPSSVSNINFYQSNQGIKVHYEKDTPLFFARIIGINFITITGKAQAEVHALSKPEEVIPVGIYHDTPLVFGQETIIYGDDEGTKGNFGLVDVSGVGIISSAKHIEDYITNGYTASDGPIPEIGDKLPTITGEKAGPVHKGFKKRIKDGRPFVICPIIDITKATGSKNAVPLLGFAKFESISTTLTGKGANEYVEVKGIFIEFIDKDAITDVKAGYYGIKQIKLVK